MDGWMDKQQNGTPHAWYQISQYAPLNLDCFMMNNTAIPTHALQGTPSFG